MRRTMMILAAAGLFLVFAPLSADFPVIRGWKGAGKPSVYQPDNLWELIDGAAELFLSYGFQKLDVRDIARQGLTVTVGIYDMGTPIQAFGIFRAEKPGNADARSIGTECVISPPYQVLILKNRFYVKVDAFEGEISEDAGEALAGAIVEALPGPDTYPPELEFLPGEGKIPGSERYAGQNYLGLTELNRCLHADYEGRDGPVRYFFPLPGEGESYETLWRDLRSKWSPLKGRAPGEKEILYREIPYEGLAGAVMTGKGIAGTAGAGNPEELLSRLERFRE